MHSGRGSHTVTVGDSAFAEQASPDLHSNADRHTDTKPDCHMGRGAGGSD
ncbi:MAG: hypothetical protein IPL36_12430 [Nigerium sp.]|nr:hypothetical protein [Nigerium sp.]